MDTATKLGEGISKLVKLNSLNLNFHYQGIGDNGAAKLLESFSKLPNLTALILDLSEN